MKKADTADTLLEITGDLWDFHAKGEWIAITTNGSVNAYGRAVMGRGVAEEAKIRYPWLPTQLAHRIKEDGGNVPHSFGTKTQAGEDTLVNILTFPVKHEWHQKANLVLIRKSAEAILDRMEAHGIPRVLYTVRPGCGNGHRKWETEVRPILLDVWAGHLDRFVIVERKAERKSK